MAPGQFLFILLHISLISVFHRRGGRIVDITVCRHAAAGVCVCVKALLQLSLTYATGTSSVPCSLGLLDV